MNDVGGVAGGYTSEDQQFEFQPFHGNLAWQFQDGAYKTIYFDGRDYDAQANAINDFDITAGSGGISDLNHIDQAFIVGQYFPRRYLLPVNEPQCYRSPSSANGINDTNTIVGSYSNECGANLVIEAVRFSIFGYATPILQSPPPAGLQSIALGVNQTGDIVGYTYHNSYENEESFLYQAASKRVTFLPPPAGEPTGGDIVAIGLNDKDQVVGDFSVPGDRFTPYFDTAFLYSGGTSYDLNTLLPKNSLGWVIEVATGINDAGQIIGRGTYRDPVNGETDTAAFIMTP